jgi:restriction system protein
MSKGVNLFDDLMAIAGRLPWWLGVLLAVLFYAVFHYIADIGVPTATTTNAIGNVVIAAGAKSAATMLQYIVPVGFLAGALVSAWGRRKRSALHRRAASEGVAAIAAMSWREFEMLIGEAFRRRGFRVLELGGQGADGGVDLVLSKQGERHVVQCKHWRAMKVPVAVVRELYGVMAAQGAASGFVVTGGEFTREARAFASGRNIELISGGTLAAMLREATAAIPSASAAGAVPKHVSKSDPCVAPPSCPKCGQPMVKRLARQGANAGNAFWGCSSFPTCRGVRPPA